MFDPGLISELIKALKTQGELLKEQNDLFLTVIIFCGGNVIAVIINIISQFRLKRYETNVHTRNLQAQERVSVMKELYKQMDLMRDINDDPALLLPQLNQTFSYLNEHVIQLRAEEEKIVREYCDYQNKVLLNHNRNKNIQYEADCMSKFRKLYQS